MRSNKLTDYIKQEIHLSVMDNDLTTNYRQPIIGFVAADDPGFSKLSQWTGHPHWMPEELLPGAKCVVSYFLPFAPEVVYANEVEKERVAREWALAYQETNAFIMQINQNLIGQLRQLGVSAAAELPTGNYDETALKSQWSQKSIAVLAGIGSFGLHQMVITDAGCAGRFGSLVIDVEIPIEKPARKERCEYYLSGTCQDCVLGCPAQAIDEDKPFDRWACNQQLIGNAQNFLDLGESSKVCGKCAVVGPCALEAAD